MFNELEPVGKIQPTTGPEVSQKNTEEKKYSEEGRRDRVPSEKKKDKKPKSPNLPHEGNIVDIEA